MTQADMELTDVTKLRAFNEVRINALVQQNWEILRDLLSPQLIFVHSSGRLEDKENYLQSLGDGKLKYISIEMPEPEISVLDDTVAVVRGPMSTEIVSKGQARVMRSYANMTWVRDSRNSWLLLSYSSTPLS